MIRKLIACLLLASVPFDCWSGMAQSDEVLNNLKQMGLAIAQYSSDYNDLLPDMSSPEKFKKLLMATYAPDGKIFVHPITGEPYLPNPRMQGHQFQSDTESVLVFESKPDKGTRAVLFNDAHVARLTEEAWQDLRVKQGIPASLDDLFDAKLANLRRLGKALLEYTGDGDRTLPPLNDVASMKAVMLPYTDMKDVFAHPDTHESYGINASLARKKLADIPTPEKMVVFYESQASNEVRGVLFLDGKVQRVAETNWPALKQQSGIK